MNGSASGNVDVFNRKKIVFKYLITILTYQIYPQTIGKD